MKFHKWPLLILIAAVALLAVAGNGYAQALRPAPKKIYTPPAENFGYQPHPTDMSHIQPSQQMLMAPMQPATWDWRTMSGTSSVKNQKCDLLIIAEGSLKKTIPLELSSETHVVGNLQWAPDGKTIYAALIAQVEGEELLTLGIIEVTVETGATREVPLAQIGKSSEREILPMVFQIGLSPDGKTIAAAPTYLGKELRDKKDLALHLVDLTSPDRKVTRIPAPVPKAPKE